MDNPPDLAERLLNYAARIIKVAETLPKNLPGRRVGDQLLRWGTAVGAHYEEARGAESRDDFVHKLQLALKELRESNYWLRLLMKSGILRPDRLAGLVNGSEQLRAILSKAVAKTKGKD
ncbi:MAG: four helix bundle protein, partial [Terriglobia bacterium]